MPSARLQGAPTLPLTKGRRVSVQTVRVSRQPLDDAGEHVVTAILWSPGDVTYERWEPYWLVPGSTVR